MERFPKAFGAGRIEALPADREFVGEELRCPTCDLSLMGSDEIGAAGLNYIREDQQEREMEYEPDYGND